MEKRWYAIHTWVSHEHHVKAALQQKLRETGQEDVFGEILVPTEKVIDLVQGKRQTVERRIFPGYILVHMALDEKTWHLVHSIPRVVGFVGEANTPIAVPQGEVEEIIRRVEAGMAAPRPKIPIAIGEKVKVVNGPFHDFTGTVEVVKPERSRVRVSVSVFGRPTSVELDFLQVEAA